MNTSAAPVRTAVPQQGPVSPDAATGADRLPTTAARQITRDRFDGHIDGLLDGPTRVVAVWGSAGSGKTTLLADWTRRARDAGRLAVWIRGTELDARLDFADLSARFPIGAADAIVFLDDAHLVRAQSRAALDELAESVPANIRIVLAGRYDPSTRHTHLQALGRLVEIRDAELAFTPDEVLQLATEHELPIDDDEASTLVQRTGGWATGIALAMPWLAGHPSVGDAVRHFDGDNRAVADYLVTEIVEGLPESDRAVLMAAAVAPTVPTELAVRLTGRADAGAVLERLAGRNTLLSRPEADEGFGYHPILLAFMEAEARRRDYPETTERHIRAAEWFAARGDGENALAQAVASRSADAVREQLDRFGLELVLTGDSVSGTAALRARISADSVASAVLRLLLDSPSHEWSAVARRLVETAERCLADDATRAVSGAGTSTGTGIGFSTGTGPGTGVGTGAAAASPTPTGTERWSAVLDIVRALRAPTPDDARAALVAMHAPAVTALRWRDVAVDLLGTTAEAWCALQTGRTDDGRRLLATVLESADALDYRWLALLVADLSVDPAAASGDWRAVRGFEDRLQVQSGWQIDVIDRPSARARLATALRRYERCDEVPVGALRRLASADGADAGIVVPATVLTLLAALDADETPRATLTELTALLERCGRAFPRSVAAACLPIFSATRAMLGEAETPGIGHLVETTLGADTLECELLAFASAPDARAHGEREARLLEAVGDGCRAVRAGTVVAAWIALARFAEKTGREVEADTRIAKALALAGELEVERPFLSFGGVGLRMVTARAGRLGLLDDVARRVAARVSPVLCQATVLEVATLTPRELDLLRELPVHQTVAEIARRHSVSANTVKTHLRSIYQKLGAADRGSAVEIAHRMGLI
ncbi:LuxR C-terminal-related transcriptional regulator [Herbiconiux daphne]|uniref:LuxR C-terminal-related transcriptional regulator n=1 Tax=Herbiconiux daphne TaxID=2970914 RepID=A0ABT2H8S9_9MICO|nr:LuxR C-terminal-related transcriptional regulator [Herbiconiux daphne]MCS5736338.1 LuxR C-terminal-related transcriptional regulator [Herbiconiux daphne]